MQNFVHVYRHSCTHEQNSSEEGCAQSGWPLASTCILTGIGQGTHEAVKPAFAVAALPARWARVGLGLASDGDDFLARFRLDAHGLRSWVSEVRSRLPRMQAFSVNPSTTYG